MQACVKKASGSRFSFSLWKSRPDSLKCWDTHLNTKTPPLVILLFRCLPFLQRLCLFLHHKQVFEKLDMRFLNHQATAGEIQLLFPHFIVDFVLAEAVTKLKNVSISVSWRLALFAELTVWQAKWRSICESHPPNKVSETLGACNNCFFPTVHSFFIVFSLFS